MSGPRAVARLPKPYSRMRLADLEGLSRDQLVLMWERAHKCPPPKGVRRSLLERSAAWYIQARSYPQLVDMVRYQLRGRMRDVDREGEGSKGSVAAAKHDRPVRSSPPPLGTRLVREWNGRAYIVDVTAEGYMLDGRAYRSLTAIARKITGTHWSGPRFFGL